MMKIIVGKRKLNVFCECDEEWVISGKNYCVYGVFRTCKKCQYLP